MTGTDAIVRLPDGRGVAYRIRGPVKGRPTIWVHGEPGSRYEQDLVPGNALARHAMRIVSVDRPGMGLSDPAPVGSYEETALDVVAVAEALGIDRAAVIAASAGGPHALALAATQPALVAGVVLLCAAGPYDDPAFMHAGDVRWMARVVAASPDALAPEFEQDASAVRADPAGTVREWFGAFPEAEASFALGPGLPALVASLGAAVAQGGAGWLREDLLRSRPWGFDVAGIRCPVRAIHGDRDQMEKVENITRILDRIPDARLTIIPGGDHLSPLLDPDRILAEAAAF